MNFTFDLPETDPYSDINKYLDRINKKYDTEKEFEDESEKSKTAKENNG